VLSYLIFCCVLLYCIVLYLLITGLLVDLHFPFLCRCLYFISFFILFFDNHVTQNFTNDLIHELVSFHRKFMKGKMTKSVSWIIQWAKTKPKT
jgi:hypothetical protein